MIEILRIVRSRNYSYASRRRLLQCGITTSHYRDRSAEYGEPDRPNDIARTESCRSLGRPTMSLFRRDEIAVFVIAPTITFSVVNVPVRNRRITLPTCRWLSAALSFSWLGRSIRSSAWILRIAVEFPIRIRDARHRNRRSACRLRLHRFWLRIRCRIGSARYCRPYEVRLFATSSSSVDSINRIVRYIRIRIPKLRGPHRVD